MAEGDAVDLRALVQRLRAIASDDGPNDSDIERDCTLGADAIESLLARAEAAEAECARLRQAADRAQWCIRLLIAHKPVRDVTETLAELDRAIAEGKHEA